MSKGLSMHPSFDGGPDDWIALPPPRQFALQDDGPDDWIAPPPSGNGDANAGAPAPAAPGQAVHPLHDGGPDDWIKPGTNAGPVSRYSPSDATLIPVAMSCSEAHRACLKMGRGATICMNAYLNCARGLPTIFGPGIVGFPK
jgi:hypothetical protein